LNKRLISEPIDPVTVSAAQAKEGGHLEPQLPQQFRWRDDVIDVQALIKTWRSTKEDRGDMYLKRHWFEFASSDGRHVVVYFDRSAKRGHPRWWLYTIEFRTTEA
jgi:Family of unknown function (DUF6504)